MDEFLKTWYGLALFIAFDVAAALVVMAIANTFIQNYEAKTLELSVAGEKIGDGPMSFEKNYKIVY